VAVAALSARALLPPLGEHPASTIAIATAPATITRAQPDLL